VIHAVAKSLPVVTQYLNIIFARCLSHPASLICVRLSNLSIIQNTYANAVVVSQTVKKTYVFPYGYRSFLVMRYNIRGSKILSCEFTLCLKIENIHSSAKLYLRYFTTHWLSN